MVVAEDVTAAVVVQVCWLLKSKVHFRDVVAAV